MVALGEKVTIHCKKGKDLHGKFFLTKGNSALQTVGEKEAEPDETVFSIANAGQSAAGIYSCRLCNHQGDGCSDFSEAAYLNITDPSLSKPSIKRILSGKSTPAGNVAIECQGPQKGLIFALYKSGEQIASRAAEPERDRVEFPVNRESLADAQNYYTCRYQHRTNPFVWSEPSEPAEPVLRGGPVQTSWAYGAAGLLLVLLLLLAFVLYRKRRKGSLANEVNQPVSVPLEPDAGEEPDGVAYAELNHQSLKTKLAADPCSVPESCVYASVAKASTREGQ